jgi:hemoglobin
MRIRAMFPRELRAPVEHQVLFLTQFFGGPADYSRERGHPALRRRHAPFPIDRVAAAAWLENMLAAMQEVAIPEPAAGVMRRYFQHTAAFLINRA